MENLDENVLKIGFLYENPFGKRVINHLIDKPGFCRQCGPLCINCRILYPWFAGKILYAHKINWDSFDSVENCILDIEEKLIPLDVLVIIGIPEKILMEIPEILHKFQIKSAIFPVEDRDWISPIIQMKLQSILDQNDIQYSFPRPFCNMDIQDNPKKSIINDFITQFRIGKPIINFSIKNGKIQKTEIIRSSPCGATFYITQYLRNEQYNSWNVDSLEKRVTDSLNKYPCIAARTRDNMIEGITRVFADKIAHDSIEKALKKAKIIDD